MFSISELKDIENNEFHVKNSFLNVVIHKNNTLEDIKKDYKLVLPQIKGFTITFTITNSFTITITMTSTSTRTITSTYINNYNH